MIFFYLQSIPGTLQLIIYIMTIIIINFMSVKHKKPDVAISNHINVIIA